MNIAAIHLVAKANFSGHVIQNDGGKGRYPFMRQADGKFVRKYENLDRTEQDKRGKTIFPELERFNRELGDLIEGRRAWPTEVRFIMDASATSAAGNQKSPPPAQRIKELVAELELLANELEHDIRTASPFVQSIVARVREIHASPESSANECARPMTPTEIAIAGQREALTETTDYTAKENFELGVRLATEGKPLLEFSDDAAVRAGWESVIFKLLKEGASIDSFSPEGHHAKAEESQSQDSQEERQEPHKLPIEGSNPSPATLPEPPAREGHVTFPWTELPEVNPSMNCHVLKKIAKTEGAWRDDLKGNAAVVQAILDGRAAKLAQLATA